MSKTLLFVLLMLPSVLNSGQPVIKSKFVSEDLYTLLLTCLNGGEASVFIGHKFAGYVKCERIKTPKHLLFLKERGETW